MTRHEKMVTLTCQRCRNEFEASFVTTRRRYCVGCLTIVTLKRRRVNDRNANAKRRGKVRVKPVVPRPVRYAGYDESERALDEGE